MPPLLRYMPVALVYCGLLLMPQTMLLPNIALPTELFRSVAPDNLTEADAAAPSYKRA